MKSPIALVLSAFLLTGCGGMDYISEPANSKLRLSAQLSGDSPANGSLSAAYSPLTQILQWELSYRGLSGPVTWAFLDGPDGTGAESELVPINLADESNPHPGSVVLTAQQANDLLAGRWSVVLKTEQFPRGEIKGALVRSTR